VESLHNGAWTVAPAPNPGGSDGGGGFGGVSTLPDGSAWAVGAYNTATSSNQSLIERFVP
jgi:hypothetical protein